MLFKADVVVPEHIIRALGQYMLDRLVVSLVLGKDYTANDTIKITRILSSVIEEFATKRSQSAGDWSLDREIARDIALFLYEGNKAEAILLFRKTTNTSTKETIEVLNQFNATPGGAASFLVTFCT